MTFRWRSLSHLKVGAAVLTLVVFWHLAVCFISSWPARTTRLRWFRGLLKNTTWRMSAAMISASARCWTMEKVNIFSSISLMFSQCRFNPLWTGSTLRPPFLGQDFPPSVFLVHQVSFFASNLRSNTRQKQDHEWHVVFKADHVLNYKAASQAASEHG